MVPMPRPLRRGWLAFTPLANRPAGYLQYSTDTSDRAEEQSASWSCWIQIWYYMWSFNSPQFFSFSSFKKYTFILSNSKNNNYSLRFIKRSSLGWRNTHLYIGILFKALWQKRQNLSLIHFRALYVCEIGGSAPLNVPKDPHSEHF